MSVEQNKTVAEKFFEEVCNNKKVELVDELVSGDVGDHNKIIFAQPEGPGVRPKVSACSSLPSLTCPPL